MILNINMKKIISLASVIVCLTACQQQPTNQAEQAKNNPVTASIPASTVQPNNHQIKSVNWAMIESGEKAIPPEKFAYPFELDSEAVKAYANVYKLDKQTARHNLTIGMAVNEVLSKLLDQLGTAYVSHELTTDKPSKFIIHTTKAIEPSKHTYVFAEPYAKGLTIDVEIINDGDKNAVKIDNPHASMPNP